MRELTIISNGFVGANIRDHKNYKKRLLKNVPKKISHFAISLCHFTDSILFNLYTDKKICGFEVMLSENQTNDTLFWLESICLNCRESILLIDPEGPNQMLRFYSQWETNNEGRFSMLTTYEYYYDKEKNKWIDNPTTYETYKKTGETPIVCDILISKKELVNKFYQAILSGLERAEKEGSMDNTIVRRSKIIEDFLSRPTVVAC